MSKSFKSIVVALFIVLFVGSFVYLYTSRQRSAPGINTNTQPGGGSGGGEAQQGIKKFGSQEEFTAFLETHAQATSGGMMREMGAPSTAPGTSGPVAPSVDVDFPSDFAGFSDQSIKNEGGGGGDYSQTNIQVQGVDEADIVKTDGKYVYALSQNNLFIVDAYPATGAAILSKIEFKSQPQNIYINGDRLIVYGYDTLIYQTEFYQKQSWPQSQYTFFKIFDISDPKNPKQLKNLDIEGNYLNSRMIGDYVYLLTSKYSYQIQGDPIPLPRIIEDGEKLLNDPTQPGFAFPNVYYFDIPYEGYGLTSVHAINIKNPLSKLSTDTYVVDPNQQLYVSEKAMYLTYTKHVSEEMLAYEVVKDMLLPKLPERDRKRIAEIEKIPDYILTPQEKFGKILVIIERYQASLNKEQRLALEKELEVKIKERIAEIQKQLERTVIHKIAIDKGTLEYKGFGDVPGYVLNQYSMDEHDGYFRIATTRSRTWSQFDDENQGESYSNVYVLDASMKTVGSLESLAKGEQIFSARFMGKRVYLVTYQQTDPFFAIDLSDPKNPKVLGELKIPGFSNYLHPYDDTTIIGLGKDSEQNQYGGVVQKGVKISLFDVADVSKPKEVAKYVVSDPSSNSLALQDPKAFLFSKERNLLVIPISTYGSGDLMPLDRLATRSVPFRQYFNGAYVFTIKKDSIELKGTIEHAASEARADSLQAPRQYFSPGVKRSLYIKEILYTLSDVALKMNKLENLADVKNLELIKNPSGQDDFIIVN